MSRQQTVQWTTKRQLYYPLITEVALSPDGRHVVHAIQEPVMTDKKSQYVTHLYLASTEDGSSIQLTFGDCGGRCPRWSPV